MLNERGHIVYVAKYRMLPRAWFADMVVFALNLDHPKTPCTCYGCLHAVEVI